jgi:uncharacterized protein YbjT (DUF2867 family)
MILIVGATGLLGGEIARRLLGQNREVRVLVRPGSAYEGLVAAGAEPVYGDLKDPDSLARACEGVEVLVTTANSAMRGGYDNIETVELQGNRNLVDAARVAGVKQFVFTSAHGVARDSPVPFLAAKAEAEEYLKASGVPYTILAPNVFMDTWIPVMIGGAVQAGSTVTLVEGGRRRHAMVSMHDVAAFAVAAVGNAAALNTRIPIGGPMAVSWSEVVQLCGRVIGRDLPVRSVALDEPIPGMPEQIVGMARAFETYDSPLEMDDTARQYGVSLTPVEAYLTRAFVQTA